MKGLLSRAGRKPRPTSPDPEEILRSQLSDEQWDQLQTLGRFEVPGKTHAYEIGINGSGPYCIGLVDEWWDDDDGSVADDPRYEDYNRMYDTCARMLALKQLIESNEVLFLRVANNSRTTRGGNDADEDEG